MNVQDLGALIRKKRNDKNLTQRQLGELLHVTLATVSKWETGVNFPDIENLKALSELLDIPISQIFDNSPNKFDNSDPAVSAPPGIPARPETATPIPPVTPEVPEKPASEPEEPPLCKPPVQKKQFRLVFVLPSVLLVTVFVVWGIFSAKGNSKFSITVMNEHYGDYEGEEALYIIMEYTGDIINIDLYEQEKNLIPKYEIPFPNEALIIFIYVENYSNYTKNGFNDITDVVSIFYPTVN